MKKVATPAFIDIKSGLTVISFSNLAVYVLPQKFS